MKIDLTWFVIGSIHRQVVGTFRQFGPVYAVLAIVAAVIGACIVGGCIVGDDVTVVATAARSDNTGGSTECVSQLNRCRQTCLWGKS